MKKYILFLITAVAILFAGQQLRAQTQVRGTSTYVLTTRFHVERGFSACNGEGGIDRVFIVQNGHDIFKEPPRYNSGNAEFIDTYFFDKNNLVSVIRFEAESTTDGAFGRCKSTDFYNATVNLNNATCTTVEGDFQMQNPRNIVYKITTKPQINLNLPDSDNNIISSDEFITISLPDNIDNQYYNWEYAVGDSFNFQPIPAKYNNVPVLNLKGADFLQNADAGKSIHIRVNMGICSGTKTTSNPITFTYLKSAPHILTSSVSPTKCFDTKDGSVTLNFDRTLLTGETLKTSLVNTDTGAGVPNQDLTATLQSSLSVTLQNLPPGKYKLDLLGTYNGNATYTDSSTHNLIFEITNPLPVDFNLVSKTDAFCFEGSDGKINISATGGQNAYQYSLDNGVTWVNFNNGTSATLENLAAGTYNIKVRDTNQCLAKTNGNDKIITVNISQPATAIGLSETEIIQPTGFGLSNGYISIRVTGGTPNTDGSYNYLWRKDSPTGSIISTGITTDAVNNPFTIKLDNLTAGNYYLTVKDKNYVSASSQLGNCGIISQEYKVSQPELLEVKIEIINTISCHIDNQYEYKLDLNGNNIPDETEDGDLKALVTGGVGAYSYQWQRDNNGTFEDITGATQSTIGNLTEGTYKILIKDANSNTTEASYTFVFPEELKISLTANTVKCNDENQGEVSVTATGGTGNYTYEWNTGDTTSKVTGLSAGNYFVKVTDGRSCAVKGTIEITQPAQLRITDVLVENPVCFGEANGNIQIQVSGGATPYTVTWSNGMTGESISGLVAGTYSVKFTDANGCFITKKYILANPEQRNLDLGKDITLCFNDTKTYDIAITDVGATYLWNKSGIAIATTSNITLSEAGTYTAIVTDSKGCTATDSVIIKNSTETLNPQFLITTHAYIDYTVKLVNTSVTAPEKVEWIIPETNDIQIVSKSDEYLELRFLQLGAYEIGLKGTQGECEKTLYKTVIVEENTIGVTEVPTSISNIKEFNIVPNPNDGQYKVMIKLNKEASVKLRLIDMLSHEPHPPVSVAKALEFEIPFNYNLPSGIYLVVLETENEAQVKKMIVK